jgi:hypothetical protein
VPAVGKKLHHKVPRFYLKAWDEKSRSVEQAQVFCLQNGVIQLTNVRNVAAENHFYRLRELSESDVSFIRKVAIDDSPESLKPYHERLVLLLSLPHRVRKELQTSGAATEEGLTQLDGLIAEMNEDIHTSIEENFKPFLNSMLAGDSTFYADAPKAANFFRGIAAQYLRTDVVKKSRTIWKNILDRVANVLVHIYAVNVGFNLYADREQYTIALLENHTEVPFVTGDQPVINIASSPKESKPPKKFELYYPLSPAKAMLLVEPSSANLPNNLSVSTMSVHVYNSHMAAHSYQQIYGSSRQVLESLRGDLSAIRNLL